MSKYPKVINSFQQVCLSEDDALHFVYDFIVLRVLKAIKIRIHNSSEFSSDCIVDCAPVQHHKFVSVFCLIFVQVSIK